jgi:hypothetical protein
VSYPKIAAFDRSDGITAATVAAEVGLAHPVVTAEDDVVTVPGARPAPNGESAPAGVITNWDWFAVDPKSVPDTFAVIPRSSYKNTSDASTGTATLVNVEPTAAVDTESAITTNEPPWDPWTLHVLETRIESCHENPDNLIALALLDRGGYCPPLPGR